MENIILSPIPKEELIAEIANTVFKKIQEASKNSINEDELIKASEAAKLLKVSLVTINQWTKEGKLIAYRMGRRIFYKRAEVICSLESTNKYNRKK